MCSTNWMKTLFIMKLRLTRKTLCLLLIGELEHLKIKTRLIDEKFVNVMCECVI
jgi:hypothetical protein